MNRNGFEIKHWIAMKFEWEDHLSKANTKYNLLRQSRRREYENDIIIKNL